MKTKELVIVSGGLGVLGQAFARVLCADGFAVLVIDLKEPSGAIAGDFFRCDITSPEDVARLKEHVSRAGVPVYGLINSAHICPPAYQTEFEEYPAAVFEDIVRVHLFGSFLLTQMVIPLMKARTRGSIVNLGSIQGIVAPTFEIYEGTPIKSPLPYALAKAGQIHFCKWIAKKYGPWNIRCNAVSPGGVIESHHGGPEFPAVYGSRTPLGRMARAEEVAEAVRFLMSEKAGYVTGQNLVVDGGWTCY